MSLGLDLEMKSSAFKLLAMSSLELPLIEELTTMGIFEVKGLF